MDSALDSSSSSSPSAKRQKLERTLLGITCCCFRLGSGLNDGFEIFLVDPNCQVNPDSLTPALRIGRAYADTLCVFGSTLYLFKSDPKPDPPPNAGLVLPKAERLGVKAARVDLSEYLSPSPLPVELDETMLTYISPTRHPKILPEVLPTPDGKILAFSCYIYYDPHDETSHQIDFELYDPIKDLWEELPPIYQDWDKSRRIASQCLGIDAYAFLNESTLFLKTSYGLFDFNLGSGRGWEDRVALAWNLPTS